MLRRSRIYAAVYAPAETLPARPVPRPKLSNVEILQIQEPAAGPAGGRRARRGRLPGPERQYSLQKHIYEIQIIHAELLKLKTNQAPVYNLVRSLGLVGPLPTGAESAADAKGTRAALAVSESSWRGSPRRRA